MTPPRCPTHPRHSLDGCPICRARIEDAEQDRIGLNVEPDDSYDDHEGGRYWNRPPF